MSKESEWKTRQQRINTKLRSLNPKWEIIKLGKFLTVEPFQESVAGYKNGNGNGIGRSIAVNH